MSCDDYFLPRSADEADLSAWASILPKAVRVIRTSLFCDAFVVDEVGSVHLLERAGCSSCLIASSEEEFWSNIKDDEQGWQLRDLADDCRNSGKVLADGQCYAFTILPVLGGAYDADNVWIAPLSDWLPFTADIFAQIKDLPDGATVSLHVSD